MVNKPPQVSFHDRYYYSGLDSKIYESIETRLYFHNVKNLRDVSFFSMILGGLFCALIAVKFVPAYMLPPYFFLAVVSLLYFIIAKTTIMEHMKLGRFLLYAFITLLLLFSDLIGIKYVIKGSLAVFFNVLIVFLPIIYVDAPRRTLPLIIINMLIFDALALFHQSGIICNTNIINSTTFGLLSIYCNFKITSKLVKQFAYEKQIEHEKNYDGLTKKKKKKCSEEMIANALSNKEKGTLIILDIDHFKLCNDTFGHIYGDQVLEKVAETLKKQFRSDDIVGRFGGDEFIVYLHHCSIQTAKRKADHYLKNLPDYFEKDRPVTCSMGIAEVTSFPTDFESLVKKADQALYLAKANGRGQACIFHES